MDRCFFNACTVAAEASSTRGVKVGAGMRVPPMETCTSADAAAWSLESWNVAMRPSPVPKSLQPQQNQGSTNQASRWRAAPSQTRVTGCHSKPLAKEQKNQNRATAWPGWPPPNGGSEDVEPPTPAVAAPRYSRNNFAPFAANPAQSHPVSSSNTGGAADSPQVSNTGLFTAGAATPHALGS